MEEVVDRYFTRRDIKSRLIVVASRRARGTCELVSRGALEATVYFQPE